MRKLLAIISVIAFAACSSPYRLARYENNGVRINGDSLQLYDSAVINMIAPYKLKLDAQMNEVIGTTNKNLLKEFPEAGLGNMVAEACLSYAQKNSEQPVDFCVLNQGGIRIPAIQAGNITVGRIYELMPFDNMIEVVTLNGEQCKDLFTWIAKWKGAPVSGLNLTLENGTATNIRINGIPFDENRTYNVATTDFIANGGDGATMFAAGKAMPFNYKLRDAIIDYIKLNQNLNADLYNGRIK